MGGRVARAMAYVDEKQKRGGQLSRLLDCHPDVSQRELCPALKTGRGPTSDVCAHVNGQGRARSTGVRPCSHLRKEDEWVARPSKRTALCSGIRLFHLPQSVSARP